MLRPSKRKIFVFFTSLMLTLLSVPVISQKVTEDKDSVDVTLYFRTGLDVTGPVIYLTDPGSMNLEGYFSADLNERRSVFLGGGYSDFKYSQYNYEYFSHGFFVKAGIDFNLLKPQVSRGKYWGGVGLHYGLSSFTSGTPLFWHQNYWGTTESSIAEDHNWGHYFEVSPGFRAEIFRNFSMGWSVTLKRLIYTGAGKDLRPIYFPGFGSGSNPFSAGIKYFFSWNIPYKQIRVKMKIEEEPEPENQLDSKPAEGLR